MELLTEKQDVHSLYHPNDSILTVLVFELHNQYKHLGIQ
jgi:hypothetical protein